MIYDSGADALGDNYGDNVVPEILIGERGDIKLVLIKNYDAAHSLHYKVTGYVVKGDTDSAEELKEETTLAAGGVYSCAVQLPYESIKVELKNATAGQASSAKVFVGSK